MSNLQNAMLARRMEIPCSFIHISAQIALTGVNCETWSAQCSVGRFTSAEVSRIWFFVWLFAIRTQTIDNYFQLKMVVCMWYIVDILHRNIMLHIQRYYGTNTIEHVCGYSEVESQHDVWRLLLDQGWYEAHYNRHRHRLSCFASSVTHIRTQQCTTDTDRGGQQRQPSTIPSPSVLHTNGMDANKLARYCRHVLIKGRANDH